MVELLYRDEATSFAILAPDGSVRVEPHFTTPSGDRLIPYSAANSLLATRCVQFSSDAIPFESKAALLGNIRDFIHCYVDLDPLSEDIAAHYVLLSWVHDAFNEVPYLRFRGRFGSGKTRALLVVGSLCYKPFFASAASTVSPIFHVLDTIGGTLVLDEADLRFSDATADLTKILNNGSTKGLPVLRTMTNKDRELNPRAFRVFGPKLLAMRGSFNDDALESRLITIETSGRSLRKDIPLSLPDATSLEAQTLRNRLLGWRFHSWHKVRIDPLRARPELTPRGNQMVLPLLAIVDDENLRNAIGDELSAVEAIAATYQAAMPEARLVRIVARLVASAEVPYVALSAIADAYNTEQIGSSVPPHSVKSIGLLIREKFGLQTRKTRGVFVIPSDQWSKIDQLISRYSIDAPSDTPHEATASEEPAGSADYALAA